MHYYTQTEGNDDWSDFINWLYFFNSSSDSAFAAQLDEHVDVDELLRLMVVESFLLSNDNLASGNNIYVYHLTDESTPDRMALATYDFEEVLQFDATTNEPEQDPDIFSFFLTLDETNYEEINPLVNRLLAVAEFNATYVARYNTFLTTLFGSQSVEQPAERYANLLQFVLPWAARDRIWQMSYGITTEMFVAVAEQTIANLPLRYANVTAQIAPFL